MKLIILDRDGVINHDSDDYIKNVDEWMPIPGSLEAIARLNLSGYSVAIASNQSGLARGFFDLHTLSQMHRKMEDLLAEHGGRIDGIFYCPHKPEDGCECRKPRPGMLLDITKRFQADPEGVLFIGDTISDMKAAVAANVNPVLVKTGKGESALLDLEDHGFNDIPVFEDLSNAVDIILSEDE